MTTLAILWLLAGSIGASGCNLLPEFLFPQKPVRVGAGQVAELAKPAKVKCWITDRKTGDRSMRTVEAWPGWLVGPGEPSPAPEPVKESAVQ